jgi:hypothetical protein
MAKYSYSLDVGKDMEDKEYEKKIKAMLEDDQPKAPKIPKKKTPKKKVKKAEKKVEKKVEEPVVEVKKQPHIEIAPAAPITVPVESSDDGGFFKWLFVLVVVLLLAFTLYKYAVVPVSAVSCTDDFIAKQEGIALQWGTASVGQQFWLQRALSSGDELIATDVLRMLSCETNVDESSNPLEFVDCNPSLTYVILDDATIKSVLDVSDVNNIPLAQRGKVAARMHNEEDFDNFVLAYKFNDETAWRVVFE